MAEKTRGPLIAAGTLIGAGLGGFIDGIALHQILQWHNMLSSRYPTDNLVNAKINMAWDGYFHLGVWVLTAIGLGLLWRAGRRPDVPWSGKTFLGSLILGWGLFNLIEGIIDHQLLGIHHVYEYTDNPLPWDLGFLVLGGILMLVIGWLVTRSGEGDTVPRGGLD
jgi:uncharacterized membrane protein